MSSLGPHPKPWPEGELSTAAQEFLKDAEAEGTLRAASLPDYRSCLRLLAEMYPNTPLEDFNPPGGTRLLVAFIGTVPEPSRKKRRAQLRSFFSWLQYYEYVRGDPTRRLKVPRSQTLHRTAQPTAQIQLLIERQPTVRDRLAIRLGFPLGLRRSAVRGIRLADFDLERDRVALTLKGGKKVYQPLAFDVIRADVTELLTTVENHAEYLLYTTRRTPYPKPHGTLNPQPLKEMGHTSFDKWWGDRFQIAQDVPYFDFHTLRHTAGHEMYRQSGGDAKVVQTWLHHASAQMSLDHYVDADAEKLAVTLQAWNSRITSSEAGIPFSSESA